MTFIGIMGWIAVAALVVEFVYKAGRK